MNEFEMQDLSNSPQKKIEPFPEKPYKKYGVMPDILFSSVVLVFGALVIATIASLALMPVYFPNTAQFLSLAIPAALIFFGFIAAGILTAIVSPVISVPKEKANKIQAEWKKRLYPGILADVPNQTAFGIDLNSNLNFDQYDKLVDKLNAYDLTHNIILPVFNTIADQIGVEPSSILRVTVNDVKLRNHGESYPTYNAEYTAQLKNNFYYSRIINPQDVSAITFKELKIKTSDSPDETAPDPQNLQLLSKFPNLKSLQIITEKGIEDVEQALKHLLPLENHANTSQLDFIQLVFSSNDKISLNHKEFKVLADEIMSNNGKFSLFNYNDGEILCLEKQNGTIVSLVDKTTDLSLQQSGQNSDTFHNTVQANQDGHDSSKVEDSTEGLTQGATNPTSIAMTKSQW